MTEPMQGNYRINGRQILEPTAARWVPREALDIAGDNRTLYAEPRTFQLEWSLTQYEDWAALQVLFDAVESTGTSVVRIPAFPTATGIPYAFREYSGVLIDEPVVDPFFETYPTRMVLIIRNIRIR